MSSQLRSSKLLAARSRARPACLQPLQVDADLMQQMEAWCEELDTMGRLGYKADIEAVYSVGGYAGLADMLLRAVLRRSYL